MHKTFTTLASLLATASIAATAQARPMTAEDVAKVESVGAIAVAPDGSRVAYSTVSLPDITSGEENGGFSSHLKLAYAPNQARAFLPEDMSVSGVAFSPDGRMITFMWTDGDEDRAVYGIPVDGGSWRKLAAVEDSAVSSYIWSADTNAIYMLVGAETDEARKSESKAGFNSIVYEEEGRLNRLFRANVGEVVDENPAEISIPGYVTSIDLLPGGTTAVIESAPSTKIDDDLTSKRVHFLDLASGEVIRTVETPGKIDDVEVSPDGSQLSMIAGVDMNDPAATTVHLVDTATAQYRALNEGAAEAIVDTEWLSDGRLATVVHVGAQSLLRIYNADGSVAEEHDPGALILTSIEAAGNTIVVRANAPTHPTELFSFNSGTFTRWTSHNPWLSEITFGEQSAYTYTARDGQEVEGVLIKPVGRIPRGGAPLILDVHGGPEAHESNGWVTGYGNPGHVAAGDGYAVFLPNYRGSTGYGTAFSKQHQGNYTDPEFVDLVDAKRALVADGIADADRTGITGGSYGGYATAWASTALSEEFAAGVMFVGISNQISKFGTGDIPYEMYNVHSRKWPWDDWQGMLEVSPVYHVDKAQTPILIMHGEEDTRVDPGQSLELYRSLKIRKPDLPVRLVFYPGEGHGNRKAAARYDYNLRMMRWFDTYLKTGDADAPLPPSRPTLPDGTTGASSGD